MLKVSYLFFQVLVFTLISSVCASCTEKSENSADYKLAIKSLEHALSSQTSLALSESQQVISKGTKSPEAFCARALAHLDFGHVDQSVQDATRACELKPNWPLALDTKAICLMEQGKIAQAEALSTQAIQLEGDNARFLLHRAEIRNCLKETNQAHSDIQKVLALGKFRAEALAERAYMLDLEKKWSEAESSATESLDLLKKEPSTSNQKRKRLARAYATRAWARNGLSNFYGAFSDANEAVNLYPTSLDARNARAWAASNLGRWSDSSNDAGMIIAEDPEAAHAYVCRAWGRLGLGKPDYALKDAVHAVDLEPFNGSALVARAAVKCAMGKLDEAESDCKQAIEKNEDYVRAHLVLSRILRARRNLLESLREISFCIAHQAPAFYYLERANLQLERKQPGLALQDITKALELEPENSSFLAAQSALLARTKKEPKMEPLTPEKK